MNKLPNCPKCNSEYTYEDGNLLICPECGYEWNPDMIITENEEKIYKDVNGNILKNGDSVIVIKDLKVKGTSSTLKMGTKVKNIRLIEEDGAGHDIDCKVEGFGAIYLKTSLVKKL
ncbi:MAG: alkylphosphonate utilization protein [Clostridiales bacterium]|nr:alkylphosphonate utilization protein [Clostridiales bacterium]